MNTDIVHVDEDPKTEHFLLAIDCTLSECFPCSLRSELLSDAAERNRHTKDSGRARDKGGQGAASSKVGGERGNIDIGIGGRWTSEALHKILHLQTPQGY